MKRFEELWRYKEAWNAHKPSSFEPMFYQDPDLGAVFPEIWYLDDCKGEWIWALIGLDINVGSHCSSALASCEDIA